MVGEAVVDPKQHFANADYRSAKGSFDHLVGVDELRRRDGQIEPVAPLNSENGGAEECRVR
jgi:hypothetical protein